MKQSISQKTNVLKRCNPEKRESQGSEANVDASRGGQCESRGEETRIKTREDEERDGKEDATRGLTTPRPTAAPGTNDRRKEPPKRPVSSGVRHSFRMGPRIHQQSPGGSLVTGCQRRPRFAGMGTELRLADTRELITDRRTSFSLASPYEFFVVSSIGVDYSFQIARRFSSIRRFSRSIVYKRLFRKLETPTGDTAKIFHRESCIGSISARKRYTNGARVTPKLSENAQFP